LKIGGVIVTQNLGMVTVQGAPHSPGIAGEIFEAIGVQGINVDFISCGPDQGGGDTMSLCFDQGRFDDAADTIERVGERLHAQKIATRENLCAVAVFGPHFREIPNIASRIFKALAEAGVNILAISTSVSSVTCVFDQEHLTAALASLRGHFDVP
jgi:aspartate kinase